MKPLHLNLASRPYRDYRPFTLLMAAGWLLFFAVAYVNVDTYLKYKTATRQTTATIARLDHLREEELHRAADATSRVGAIDTRLLSAQIEFANSQLAERAFSWSELLDRLEHVLPDDVRIDAVAPRFDKTGLIHLMLSCHGKGADSMLRTMALMTRDPNFANPFPNVEDRTEKETRFTIDVDYRPAFTRMVP